MAETAVKPRRLLDPEADEISFVDVPANEEEFALIKRKDKEGDGDMDETLEGDVENGEESGVAELLGDAADVLKRVAAAFQERLAEERKRRARRGKKIGEEVVAKGAPTLWDLAHGHEESEALVDLLEEVEKVYGPYPYPFPRRYPTAGGYPYPAAGAPFDAGKLMGAIDRALATAGIPADVKAALEELHVALGGKKRKAGKDDEEETEDGKAETKDDKDVKKAEAGKPEAPPPPASAPPPPATEYVTKTDFQAFQAATNASLIKFAELVGHLVSGTKGA